MNEIQLETEHLLSLSNLGIAATALTASIMIPSAYLTANTLCYIVAIAALTQSAYHYNKSGEVSFSVKE